MEVKEYPEVQEAIATLTLLNSSPDATGKEDESQLADVTSTPDDNETGQSETKESPVRQSGSSFTGQH